MFYNAKPTYYIEFFFNIIRQVSFDIFDKKEDDNVK